MRKPFKLENEALKFWDCHAKDLEKRGLLAPNSRYSFGLLCQTWGLLQGLMKTGAGADVYREMAQLGKLHGLYQNLAKQFGLLPAAARRDKLDQGEPEETDEFGL
jgi:phage terminase small subunit